MNKLYLFKISIHAYRSADYFLIAESIEDAVRMIKNDPLCAEIHRDIQKFTYDVQKYPIKKGYVTETYTMKVLRI